jgi:hypothetical protein
MVPSRGLDGLAPIERVFPPPLEAGKVTVMEAIGPVAPVMLTDPVDPVAAVTPIS